MSRDMQNPPERSTGRYEALLRISEAHAECREPEELAKGLADQLSEFLSFEHLDVVCHQRSKR